jgi:hypothetical protein
LNFAKRFTLLLSHYTNRAGLESIARSKTLWATRFTELNDKREMEYGFVELMTRALRATMDEVSALLNPEERRPMNYDAAGEQIAIRFRLMFEGTSAHEPLYVFSFAKGKTDDQDRRGILTLWDRYTHLEGYCLQYEATEVRKLLELEATRRNYALLDLAAVHYGIDEDDQEYKELLFQLKQYLLIEVARGKPGLGVQPQYDKLWPITKLGFRLLNFYSKHKDPFFEDERETRIIAVPAKEGDSRPLIGLALRKPVLTMSDGRHYIDIGVDWSSRIEPLRIIVGPKAVRDLDAVLALFDRKPEVYVTDFPLKV